MCFQICLLKEPFQQHKVLHKVRSIKELFSKFVVEELDWPAQSPDPMTSI